MAIILIEEAVDAGARRYKACAVLGISCRTLRRWQATADLTDKRQQPASRAYAHALTPEEKDRILDVCNSAEYQSLPPSQIVPRLADRGIYLASESSFYRVLKAHGQQNRRGRAQPPRIVMQPQSWVANTASNGWRMIVRYGLRAFLRLFFAPRLGHRCDNQRLIVGFFSSQSTTHFALMR